MKKLILLLLFIPLLSCSSGDGDDHSGSNGEKTRLTLTNKDVSIETVIEIRLVGYKFESLNIEAGTSKTFVLENGINGGMSNVKVEFWVDCVTKASYWKTLNIDFKEGHNTIVRFEDPNPNDTTPMSCGDSSWTISS